ncbi:MAG: hypothetical protein RLZZ464_988 [Pseudomonadota bacterium]|jgi:hypothetical protein
MLHLLLLLGISGALDFQLNTPPARVSPLQTRMLTAPAPAAAVAPAPAVQHPRTRIAQQVQTSPVLAPEVVPDKAPDTSTSPQAEPPRTEVAAPTDTPATPAAALPEAAAHAPTEVSTAPPAISIPPGESLPNMALGALPPSSLLRYDLIGQEKGLTYYASGELSWQHNPQAYALALSVKAFLVGSRHWRSVGDITAAGLAPRRFSDSWRGERAAHFDRDKNRIVFSGNAPEAPLLAGAQDQISLYVQLAAAMNGSPERFAQGTRLQIQTITLRDALPWTLTLEQNEALTVEGQSLMAAKWVCQPRNRFDAKVEFWVTPQHHWLPVRIRITQVSGNYIDLNLRSHETLAALAPSEKATPP